MHLSCSPCTVPFHLPPTLSNRSSKLCSCAAFLVLLLVHSPHSFPKDLPNSALVLLFLYSSFPSSLILIQQIFHSQPFLLIPFLSLFPSLSNKSSIIRLFFLQSSFPSFHPYPTDLPISSFSSYTLPFHLSPTLSNRSNNLFLFFLNLLSIFQPNPTHLLISAFSSYTLPFHLSPTLSNKYTLKAALPFQ